MKNNSVDVILFPCRIALLNAQEESGITVCRSYQDGAGAKKVAPDSTF